MEENQNDSDIEGQRRSPRIENCVLLKYVIFDDKGMATDHGEGQAINLSQNGILIETLKPLNGIFVVLMTLDPDDKGVKMKGRLIFSNMQKNTGHYLSGINFIGPKDQQVAAIVAFIRSYSRSRSKGKLPGLPDNQNHSDTKEQRRSPRIETDTLVKYIILDNEGKNTDHGEGQAINLSQNGMLLATRKPLKNVFVMLMTFDLNGKVVKVKGRPVSSNMQETIGYYFAGIDFIEPMDQQVTAVMEENQKHSGTGEQRRSPRTENINLVDYAVFDDNGKVMNQGKGRTLNLSQNGILLETLEPLKGVFIILTLDLDGKGVNVKGRLIYSNMQKNTGHYFSGIDLIGPKDQQVAAIVAFIKSYSQSKSKGNIPKLRAPYTQLFD